MKQELISKRKLIDYYTAYEKTIEQFYEINNQFYSAEALCKKAITGSTYRSFVRNEPKSAIGMSKIFKEVACSFFESDPTLEQNQKEFLDLLSCKSIGLFRNLPTKDIGLPKLLKLYNLYANYWVAFKLKGNLNDKKSYLRRLKIPLDKYSLTFIRTIYNETKIDQDFHLGRDLGMGSVKSIDHYNSINNFIDELSEQISLETNKNFFPIYLDIIQAGVNNLNWYTVNIQR
jgi:hypothetical protein